MSISISNAVSPAELSTGQTSAKAAAPPVQQSKTNNEAYVVKLSQAQQVAQLYKQGQHVSQIATKLSLPVETVNSYLGITNPR